MSAMSFGSVGKACTAAAYVFGVRYGLYMLRINAAANAAKMIKLHALWDRPNFPLIKEFVSDFHFATGHKEVSVAIWA